MGSNTWKGNFLMRSSVDFWYRLISWRANAMFSFVICWVGCISNAKYLESHCACSVLPFLFHIRWSGISFCLLPCEPFVDNFPLDLLEAKSSGRSEVTLNIDILHHVRVQSKSCLNHLPRCFPPCGLPCSLLHTRHIYSSIRLNSNSKSLSGNTLYFQVVSLNPKSRELVWSHWSGQGILESALIPGPFWLINFPKHSFQTQLYGSSLNFRVCRLMGNKY